MPVPGLDLDTAGGQLGWLLATIAQKLQLSDTQHARAVDHYEAVGRYLKGCAPQLHIDIYPQGSMALQTTVKPRGQEEYDVDLVLEIGNYPSGSPMGLYTWVLRNLQANGRYAEIVEPLKRCIRLNYAGDFHLDVLPARPALLTPPGARYPDSCVDIPDTELMDWMPSNPRGYVKWFEQQCEGERLLQKRAQVPLPDNDSAHLRGVLRQIVQLVKRQRDVWFRDDGDAPRSIVLTTLVAHCYHAEGNLYGALQGASERIAGALTAQPLKVVNPTNLDEVFSESWHKKPAAYGAFRGWWSTFAARIENLGRLRGPELDGELGSLFGETVARGARAALTKRVEQARRSGELRSAGRRLTTGTGVGTVVRSNTFFGDADDA